MQVVAFDVDIQLAKGAVQRLADFAVQNVNAHLVAQDHVGNHRLMGLHTDKGQLENCARQMLSQ
ncbi:hypothetical protein D3C81_1465400 [compost metagenome]